MAKTKSPTQRFLERAMEAEKEIKRLRDREKRYREMAEGLGGGTGGVGGHGGGARSRLEEAVAELDELREYVAKRVKELAQEIMEVESVIEGVKTERYREVLERRYLHDEMWLRVSKEMGYQDEKSVYRVHGWAIKEAEKVLKEKRATKNNTMQS